MIIRICPIWGILLVEFWAEMLKIGQIRIMDRRLLFFPGRFSTCNLVFRGFGGQGVQVVKKNEMNRSIFDTSLPIFSNFTHILKRGHSLKGVEIL